MFFLVSDKSMYKFCEPNMLNKICLSVLLTAFLERFFLVLVVLHSTLLLLSAFAPLLPVRPFTILLASAKVFRVTFFPIVN